MPVGKPQFRVGLSGSVRALSYPCLCRTPCRIMSLMIFFFRAVIFEFSLLGKNEYSVMSCRHKLLNLGIGEKTAYSII